MNNKIYRVGDQTAHGTFMVGVFYWRTQYLFMKLRLLQEHYLFIRLRILINKQQRSLNKEYYVSPVRLSFNVDP